jgi:hypothetical protein
VEDQRRGDSITGSGRFAKISLQKAQWKATKTSNNAILKKIDSAGEAFAPSGKLAVRRLAIEAAKVTPLRERRVVEPYYEARNRARERAVARGRLKIHILGGEDPGLIPGARDESGGQFDSELSRIARRVRFRMKQIRNADDRLRS